MPSDETVQRSAWLAPPGVQRALRDTSPSKTAEWELPLEVSQIGYLGAEGFEELRSVQVVVEPDSEQERMVVVTLYARE